VDRIRQEQYTGQDRREEDFYLEGRVMKMVKMVVIGMVVLVILVVVVGWLMMNGLVRKGVEVGATGALGVKTTLASASVHPFGGSVTLSGLNIANPEGFTENDLLTREKGTVKVRMGSLMSKTVEVEDILIEKPVLTIESKGLGQKTNISTVMDGMGKGEKKEAAQKEGKGIKIKHIMIKGAVAKFVIGKGDPLEVPLSDIEMTDLGTGESNGVKLGMVAMAILTQVTAQAALQSGGKVSEAVLGEMKGAVNGAKGAVEGLAKALPKLEDIKLPDVKLPDVKAPDIKLPDIKLPGSGN